MFQTVTKVVKWASIPVLLIASLFAYSAAKYEPLVDLVVCAGALILIQRAVWLKEYFWAAGFLAIGVAFTPISVVVKLFLLMALACIATFANLVAAFRPHPAPVLKLIEITETL